MSPLAEMKLRLQRARVSAAGQPLREFVPDGCLQQILTAEAVLSVLADSRFTFLATKLKIQPKSSLPKAE